MCVHHAMATVWEKPQSHDMVQYLELYCTLPQQQHLYAKINGADCSNNSHE